MIVSSDDRSLLEKTFSDPPAHFRGVPFWAWNCKVTEDKIISQTECFRRMGMGGAMIHPRTGMETPYLSDEYFHMVKRAEEELRRRGMSCWLYDEERFPSGCAGGFVTRDLRFRARILVLTKEPMDGYCADKEEFDLQIAAGEKPRGYYLCAYRICLKDGFLVSYERCVFSSANRFAYVELWPESSWFNGESYVDVFNPEAIDAFLSLTHEKYARALGEHFGGSVPAIFTDEPHMKGKYCLPEASSDRATLAYTDDMNVSFRSKYGTDLLNILPEIIWELPKGRSVWRLRYHEHAAERFASSYGDRIGSWCEKHHILYTGHFLSERTLYSQTLALGETMRQYRSQHLPGIDILAGQIEITTAKQAESVRRQMGKKGLVCELYGVLQWDVTFRQHKLQGDWLASLGVNVRVHHLAFMGMGGEAKRDWPASIGWQSPWWEQYSWLEDYFARVNVMLTRGTPVTRVAVLHPIESFWLLFGPNDLTGMQREQMDEQFENLARWLLYGGIDFDYLSESMLPSLCAEGGYPLRVGQCAYEAVIVPPVLTLRSTTLQRLSSFSENGGTLIFLGGAPDLIDGLASSGAKKLWESGLRLPMERAGLLDALMPFRDILICGDASGRLSDNLFYQLRQDGKERILFICHVRDEGSSRSEVWRITLRGAWHAARMNAPNGTVSEMGGTVKDGNTVLIWRCHAQDSLLLRLSPGQCAPPESPPGPLRTLMSLSETDDFTLEEPNALLLDRCEYALDDGPWQKCEEILRADNALRVQAGLPLRGGEQVQPWLVPHEKAAHTARLRYRFYADRSFTGLKLAMEHPENARIILNGKCVPVREEGWYVDEAIRKLALPEVSEGENTLILSIPMTRRADLEPMYILGAFGVRAAGTHLTLTSPPERLFTDDLTRQGLPFYTGNVRYCFRVRLERDHPDLYVHLPRMASPVAVVFADGKEIGKIAWQPFRIRLPRMSAGEHEIAVLVCGSRYNAFGTLHNADPDYKWYGPSAFRTEGDDWTENYLFRPSYLLSPVELMEETP